MSIESNGKSSNVTIPVFRLRRDGGVERYTWEVAAYLARTGHAIRVICGEGGHPPPAVELKLVGHAHPVNTYRGGLAFAAFPPRARLRAALRRDRAVVYGPVGSALPPGVVTTFAVHAAWLRARARHFDDTHLTMFDRSQLAVEWITYHAPRKIVTALSPGCARELAELYGIDSESVVVIPPAVDSEEFSPVSAEERAGARRRWNVDPSAFVVGIAANYAFRNKGVADLISACAKNHSTLVVAGIPDRQHGYYERLAEGAGGDVRFLGAVTEMRAFYGALDVFALPSAYEAYGMAAHEAMACGIATIVSSPAGIAEVATAGLHLATVEPRDVEQLGAAISELQDDERRRRLAVSGSTWAVARTWDHVGAEVVEVIESYRQGAGKRRS
jgi:glycosyltransferase involved in cell wall biosynthesis